jgi:hypothetical protein
MKPYLLLASLLFAPLYAHAQFNIVWTERSAEFNLPQGVRVFTGHQNAPPYLFHYLEMDMANPNIILHPYWSSTYKTTSTFSRDVGAIAAINGGFFSTSSSVSTMIEPGGNVRAQNIQVLNRDGINYPVGRAFFGILPDRSMRVDWVYHFSNDIKDFYRYDNVFPNVIGTPAATPTRAGGILYDNVLMGLAGGPNLVSNGVLNVTYDQEVFFGGSGLEGASNRARSAIGYTADNKVIMLVAESGAMIPGGDFQFSSGATLENLGRIMIQLGCVEAMNLDGGGSSTLAIGNTLYNRPQGGTSQRPVPTIFAVVPADSLKIPPPPLESVIIDTQMPGVSFQGDICAGACSNGWFQTANLTDSYGGTGSWLSERINGSRSVTYNPTLLTTEYEVFGWWSASFNRATDTPYIIRHKNGETTVRVNQSQRNAQWVSLGKFEFTGTANDQVRITNGATAGTYVVADAIKFQQLRQPATSVDREAPHATSARLHANYPNPFNPGTVIRWTVNTTGPARLAVYDLLGRELTVLVDETMAPGDYHIRFEGAGLPSGTYLYTLTHEGTTVTRRMTLVK